MQTVDTKFDYDGFTFWLIMRQGNLALFAKTKPDHSRWSYEVVIIQVHEPKTFASGRSYPEREAIPRSEDWGECGWTPFSYERAVSLFERKALEYRWHDRPKYEHPDLEAFTLRDDHSFTIPAMEIPPRTTAIERLVRPPEKGCEENGINAGL